MTDLEELMYASLVDQNKEKTGTTISTSSSLERKILPYQISIVGAPDVAIQKLGQITDEKLTLSASENLKKEKKENKTGPHFNKLGNWIDNETGLTDKEFEEQKKEAEQEAVIKSEVSFNEVHTDIFGSGLLEDLINFTNTSVKKNTVIVVKTLNKPDIKKNLVLEKNETQDDVVQHYKKKLAESYEDLLKKFDKALLSRDISDYLAGVDYIDNAQIDKIKLWWKTASNDKRKALYDDVLERVDQCSGEIATDYERNSELFKQQKILTHTCFGDVCKPVVDFESRAELITKIDDKIRQAELGNSGVKNSIKAIVIPEGVVAGTLENESVKNIAVKNAVEGLQACIEYDDVTAIAPLLRDKAVAYVTGKADADKQTGQAKPGIDK